MMAPGPSAEAPARPKCWQPVRSCVLRSWEGAWWRCSGSGAWVMLWCYIFFSKVEV